MRAIVVGLFGVVLSVSGAGAAQGVRAKAAIACAEKVRSTADTRACWVAQIDQANRSLDQENKRFLEAVPPEKRETLVSAKANWEKYHLSHCNLYIGVFEGTMWHPVSDQCVLEKVEERLKELTTMRRTYEQ